MRERGVAIDGGSRVGTTPCTGYNWQVLLTLEEVCEKLVDSWDPEKIILFGSRATGKEEASSDYDLLIIKGGPGRPADRRAAAEKILQDRGVPLDIFVYSPKEVLFLYSIGSPFIQEVLETGRVLYMRKATEQWMKDAEEELRVGRYSAGARPAQGFLLPQPAVCGESLQSAHH